MAEDRGNQEQEGSSSVHERFPIEGPGSCRPGPASSRPSMGGGLEGCRAKLGSGLPSDYKEYVTRFGPGFLEKDYIRIAMPGIPDEWGRNYGFSTTSGSEVAIAREPWRKSCIRSGLSRVACSRGGDLLCGHVLLGHVSKTSGQVDGCRVHSRTIRMVQLRRQHESILVALLTRRITVPFLVADLGAPPRPLNQMTGAGSKLVIWLDPPRMV